MSASTTTGAIRLVDLASKNSKTHGQYGQFARLVVGNIRVMADLGQNRHWPNRFWPNRVRLVCVCCVAWVLVSRFPCGGVGFTWDHPSRDHPSQDHPFRDRPSPRPPKISLFFFLSRRKIRSFLPSLGGLLVEFWLCLGSRGFTRQPENSKRAHLSAPAFKTPPKFHEKPQRGKKKTNYAAGEEKKSAKFRAPTLRAPTF